MTPHWAERLRVIAARRRHGAVLFALLAVSFPLLAPPGAVSLGFVALQYVLLALGLNVVVGWVGLLDLGAAGFVAVGAYATAILTTQFGWPPLAALPAAFAIGSAAGALLGLPTLRHREDYFAILTLGFAELVALLIRNWTPVTRGAYGYSGIPAARLPFLSEPLRAFPPVGFYYFALAVAVPIYFGLRRLRATPLGRHFHLVRHNEALARCYGVSVLHTKLAAFSLSAGLLAVGGFFWALYQRSIVWTEFGVPLSCMLLSLLVAGGLGNLRGAVAGAVSVGILLELFRRVLTAYMLPQNIRFLLFAAALLLFARFRPRGLLPDRPRWDPPTGSSRIGGSAGPQYPEPAASDPGAPLLAVEGVKKSFGGVKALDGLSFQLRRGECVALVGPNGSGKSTLVNAITGLLRLDGGVIRLAGERIDCWPAHRIARAGIGRSFQDVSVLDDVSVRDNIFITSSCVTADDVNHAMATFGVPADEGDCSKLSYGMKKSLDLARLLVEPERWRLVLLDEPTAGLNQAEVIETAKSLAAVRNRFLPAMLVISHDIVFLESLQVDRVVVLYQGRKFKEGPFSAMRADPEVRNVFWGAEVLV